MPGVSATLGSKVYIGGTTEFDTINEYEGESWTEVADIEDTGEFGDTAADVTFTAVGDGRTRHFKGAYDAGSWTMTFGFNSADAGQNAVRDALAVKDNYNFKVEFNDGSPGSPSQPTICYFRGKVMSATYRPGTANDVVRSTVTVGIDSEILNDPAV